MPRRRPIAAPPDQAEPDPWEVFLAEIVGRWSDAGPDRKQDRSRKREREILRAALRVFARDGISRSRIGDVAAEAGMAVSTIYEYYPSKEELAYAVPLNVFGEFYLEYAQSVAGRKSWAERLRHYLWLAVDFARRNPEWSRTLYLEIWPSVLVSETMVRHAINDYVRIILYMIREGAKAGEWPEDPHPYETAAILNGSVNQTIITWLIYRRPHDVMKAASSIIDRTMALMQPQPEPVPARRRGTTAG